MNIDFSACANFKGNNQKPLFLAEGRGLFRPSIKKIAENALDKGLDAVVLRSFSHPEGTDDRWNAYRQQMEGQGNFNYLENGIALYQSPNSGKKLVLIHGQGLATSEGNIQVLFAENQVGQRGREFNTNFYDLVYRARESGEGVLITAARPYAWRSEVLENVDVLETWNGMDSNANNEKAAKIAHDLEKPGVYVSNSKCLPDLGSSYTTLTTSWTNFESSDIAHCIRLGLSLLGKNGIEGKRGKSTFSKLIQALAVLEVKVTGNKD